MTYPEMLALLQIFYDQISASLGGFAKRDIMIMNYEGIVNIFMIIVIMLIVTFTFISVIIIVKIVRL